VQPAYGTHYSGADQKSVSTSKYFYYSFIHSFIHSFVRSFVDSLCIRTHSTMFTVFTQYSRMHIGLHHKIA